MNTDLIEGDLTKRIIGCCYAVHNTLGPGFLEKVYENALAIELGRQGMRARQQAPIAVYYVGQRVGEYIADIVVNDAVILELKAQEALSKIHEAQLVSYLRATGKRIGLLVNFGSTLQFRRRVV